MSQPAVPLVSLDDTAQAHVPARNRTRGHDVQFYESEQYLAARVAAFLVEGVRTRQPVVVIATEVHRRMFEERMRAAGVRPEELVEGHDVVWIEAREALRGFMEGDHPNAELFEATIGSVFAKVMNGGRWRVVVRAYGEMVDLLWKDGRIEGAIALEHLWNDLARKYSFALLCAYSMGNFLKETHGTDFARICAAHGHVTPTEGFTSLDDADRLTEVARLQQRSRALDAEIAYRKEVEAALLDVISHRRRMEEVVRRSEEELRDLLDNAPIAIHWVDAAGKITWANRHELSLLGYTHREYVGRQVADFHLDRENAQELLRRLANGETIRDYPATLRCRDASLKHVLISSNVRWKDGQFEHTRCFTREIGALSLS